MHFIKLYRGANIYLLAWRNRFRVLIRLPCLSATTSRAGKVGEGGGVISNPIVSHRLYTLSRLLAVFLYLSDNAERLKRRTDWWSTTRNGTDGDSIRN